MVISGCTSLKDRIRNFWDESSCGEVYALGGSLSERLTAHARRRYELEPYLPIFARFDEGTGLDVLEVGVGMGADHVEWARHGPASLTGVDLTSRAVQLTADRLALYGLESDVQIADAEHLPFPSHSFDLVYSWGVLHHSPDTLQAIGEVHRVLRPGGRARIMIYHRLSLVGLMLWLRYALGRARPWVGLDAIYSEYLESPGTKAYSVGEARRMFARYEAATVRTQLSFGDLLEGEVGQQHQTRLVAVAKALWPRFLLRRIARGFGLLLLIDAVK